MSLADVYGNIPGVQETYKKLKMTPKIIGRKMTKWDKCDIDNGSKKRNHKYKLAQKKSYEKTNGLIDR